MKTADKLFESQWKGVGTEHKIKGTSMENHFGHQSKLQRFTIIDWEFKSCNFVHRVNHRPFALRFWPFQFPSLRHLEL